MEKGNLIIGKMQQLNRTHTGQPKVLPLKVMQFGGGNFLRAFVDWMVQVLNEETGFQGGIAIIKPTERGDYSELKSQEGLFTVVLDGISEGKLIAEKKQVAAVQEVINCYSEWQAYLDLAKSETIRFIVSNTTEAGIKFNPQDTKGDAPPKEFPAKLTYWLYHRFLYFKGSPDKGCILLPCELIENNGEALKKAVLQYADHWKLEEAFTHWIKTANHFCSTLVDRIVSGYPNDRAESIQNALGYQDGLLVAGEYYHSWVIQGPEILRDELPFAKTGLNVSFVDDLAPYREMKVRILNGAHTSMVPVGYLAGIRFVKDVMEDDIVGHFVETLLLEEAAKTLNFPDSVKHRFVQDVLDRFRNPLLRHQLISIALNSTSKFVARLLPTLKDYHSAHGQLPERIVFGLAAMIVLYRGTWAGAEIDLRDDPSTLEFFRILWKKLDSGQLSRTDFTKEILENTSVWGEDLTQIHGLTHSVAKSIEAIGTVGIRQALEEMT